MFSRDSDKPTKSSNSSSVIGTEMQISGNIKCTGNLVLKGKVKGNIECENMSISAEGNLKDFEDGISPCQACVFYEFDKFGYKVLGGGWIIS